MKITAKTTKEQMTNYLRDNAKEVAKKDKSLFDRLSYTSKMYKKDESKVTKTDLATLVREVVKCLAQPVLAEETPAKSQVSKKSEEKETKTKAENSLKKPKAGSKPKEESTASNLKVVEKSEVKKPVEKGTSKKVKQSAVEKMEPLTDKSFDMVDIFKDEIEINEDDEVIKYQIARDLETIEDVHKALEDDETLIFAMYWSERLLKQFSYFNGDFPAPKSFPLDLDIATCLYVSDNGTVAYALSIYSEGMYVIKPESIKQHKGVRFANGMEFQIYRQV